MAFFLVSRACASCRACLVPCGAMRCHAGRTVCVEMLSGRGFHGSASSNTVTSSRGASSGHLANHVCASVPADMLRALLTHPPAPRSQQLHEETSPTSVSCGHGGPAVALRQSVLDLSGTAKSGLGVSVRIATLIGGVHVRRRRSHRHNQQTERQPKTKSVSAGTRAASAL